MRPFDRLWTFAPLAFAALIAASPSPGPSPAPIASPAAAAARTLQVVCERTPLWIFVSGDDRPRRAEAGAATIGQRFALVSGPRTTLEGNKYYETDIVIAEPGLSGHYWLSDRCAIPSS
ncbi:MAG: hypothetical protein JWO85_324 [Candidatus Eremiobacteraeota bacterium]|nr:hypothetical protein [Candidatus Eremiobacteraeota bacterium]